ncbi:MAG: hypothetical protein F4X17_16365 [Gemmatimonadetes bacterium]|nr:hypothetical protein [Gemmatimonadota bacterium]
MSAKKSGPPQSKPIRISILTSLDLPRLKRAIQSVQEQTSLLPFWVEINSRNSKYVDRAATLCEEMRVEYHISKSTGKPGIGKQAVFDRFTNNFQEPFLFLLDGDDWLYPCASQSIQQTIHQYSSLDVVTYIPLDLIQPRFGHHPIAKGAYANFWNGILCSPHYWEYGPGIAQWLWTSNPIITGPGPTPLFSRKAASTLSWHPQIGAYEDTLLLLDSLVKHQAGDLFSACSMAQDIFIYDQTNPQSVQKKTDLVKASIQLRQEATQRLNKERSSIGELPLLYQESLITYPEKIEFAQQTYSLKGKP